MNSPHAILGLVWVHGAFEAAVWNRHAVTARWVSPAPVRTLDDFAQALEAACTALAVGGGTAALVLEHEDFIHRTEAAPPFAERTARKFLKARLARYEREHGPTVWVAQNAPFDRRDTGYLLHILPRPFYERIIRILESQRLVLKQLVPLVVPLQGILNGLPAPGGQAALLATAAGRGTLILVGWPGSGLIFFRLIMASSQDEPVRVAIEVNRSLLFAKKQFGLPIERAHVFAGADAAREIKARCPTLKEVSGGELATADWLPGLFHLSDRSPLNLVAAYQRPRQRRESARRFLMAAAGLGVILAIVDLRATRDEWRGEQIRWSALQASRTSLADQLDRLRARNARAAAEQALVGQALDQHLPPVASRFLAYLPTLLPPEVRLTQFTVTKAESGAGWAFHLEGRIPGDAIDAGESLAVLEDRLRRCPLRVRLTDANRTLTNLPPNLAVAGETSQVFILEGGLFED